MTGTQSSGETVVMDIENIGGIDTQTLEFEPGITFLTGKNATNRSSTLRAIMAACGSDRTTIKADADEGTVTLTIGDSSYTRTIEQTDGDMRTDGSPLLTDDNRVEAADYFAFLLADNEARLSVLNPESNLRDIVMGPVDTEAIEERITQLQDELDAINEDRTRRDTLQNEKLPRLKAKREELQADIDALEEQIRDAEAELEEADNDVETSKEQQDRIDSLTSDLRDARAERDRLNRRLENEKEALAEARNERKRVQEALAELDVPDDTDRGAIEETLSELRAQRDELNDEINTLTTIISFNEEQLTGEGTITKAVAAALDQATESDSGRTADSLTQQLVEPADNQREIRCWTCGQEADKKQIEQTVDALRKEVQKRQSARSETEERIAELEAELDSFEETQREKRRLQDRLSTIEGTIAETEELIDSLQEQRQKSSERVEEREERLSDVETDDAAYNRVIELHRRITELETEKEQKEAELDEVETEIESVRAEISELEGIESERERLREQLEQQKRRIETLREEITDTFNENMDTLLKKLKFENIERVWLECRREELRQGRRVVEETVFDLHVVRETEDGSVFEDKQGVQHLSESERNVVGLVFALAGYLAHNVYQDLPFMLLDSLEAIDAERLAFLIDHFSQYADYLVVTLLPEVRDLLVSEVDPQTVLQMEPTGP
jgi:DNA repair exonuclease SbcCD ATPase subunit